MRWDRLCRCNVGRGGRRRHRQLGLHIYLRGSDASLQQPRQRLNQFLVVAFAFVADRFDAREHLADGIDHREQRGRHLRIQRKFSVAQLAEQVFANVRDGFEFCEPEKSTGAFDRVDCAENARERAAIARVLLRIDEFAVEQVEVFAALNQKFADDVVAHAESRSHKIKMHCGGDKSRLTRCYSRFLENQTCRSGASARCPGLWRPRRTSLTRTIGKCFSFSNNLWVAICVSRCECFLGACSPGLKRTIRQINLKSIVSGARFEGTFAEVGRR
jgi:hypothetical protein